MRILGQEYPRRAEVETIGGYSAHADRSELRAWLRRLGGPVRRAFVVHGEAQALGAMATILLLMLASLLAAGPLMRVLGPKIEAMITRVLGVILAALAAQFVIDGIKASFA